jgi:hypothetical protein
MEHRIDQEYRQNVMVGKVFKIEKEHEVISSSVGYKKWTNGSSIKTMYKGRIYVSEKKQIAHLCIVPLFLSSTRQIFVSCISVGLLYSALSDVKESFKGIG